MNTELAFVLCTVLFLLTALATVMGIPMYIFMKLDDQNSASKAEATSEEPEVTKVEAYIYVQTTKDIAAYL